jgi:hypothetical protein
MSGDAPVEAATAAHAAGSTCCQAVLHAFRGRLPVGEEVLAAARGAGGGRAPGGRCGALHAAHLLVPAAHHPGIEADFVRAAGSAICREIRRARAVSCRECVAAAARLVARHHGQAGA